MPQTDPMTLKLTRYRIDNEGRADHRNASYYLVQAVVAADAQRDRDLLTKAAERVLNLLVAPEGREKIIQAILAPLDEKEGS
jgi:hypothetical protein